MDDPNGEPSGSFCRPVEARVSPPPPPRPECEFVDGGLDPLAEVGCVVPGRYEVLRNPTEGSAASDVDIVRTALCSLKPQRCEQLNRWDSVVYLCETNCRHVEFVPHDEVVDGGVMFFLHGGAHAIICGNQVLEPEWKEPGFWCGHPLLQR
jgi:hypothetical protein